MKEKKIKQEYLIRKWKIYAYINQINNKIYIGQTCRTLKERSGKDGKLYEQCIRFGRAIAKYGWNNFKPIILLENLNREEANLFEIELIKKYDATNPQYGYNISKGGSNQDYNSIDITGQTFGNLTAIELVETNKRGRYWLCQCSCGEFSVVRQDHLRNGTTKSCQKCGLKTKKVIPNDFQVLDDRLIQVNMSNNYHFIINTITYETLKDSRWCYDVINNRIVNSKTGVNIVKYIFPQFKRNRFARYVEYKDNSLFNLSLNNLYILVPTDVNESEWFDYLSDDNKIRYVSNNGSKKWKNSITNKTYKSYIDAKNSLGGE